MRILLLLAICISSVSFADLSYLCHGDEEVVFGCQVGKKIVSVCGSRNFTPTTGYVQYRFDTADNLELEYPKDLAPAHEHFWASHTMYSGGGETRMRFVNQNVTYLIYDTMYRTRYDGENNGTQMTKGVFIRTKAEDIDKACSVGNGFVADKYKKLDEETFDHLLGPGLSRPSASGQSGCSAPKIEFAIEKPTGSERMRITLAWLDLDAGPQWQPGQGEVPLSPAKAIALIKSVLGSKTNNLYIQQVSLYYLAQCGTHGPHWYYQASVGIPGRENAVMTMQPPIVVLLNGKVLQGVRVEDEP